MLKDEIDKNGQADVAEYWFVFNRRYEVVLWVVYDIVLHVEIIPVDMEV